MNHRGLTLIELVAAIALLAAISIAAAGWMRFVARVAEGPLQDCEWRRVAMTALARLGEDLNAFERIDSERSSERSPRVRLTADDRLQIDTRADGVGAVRREYAQVGSRLVRRTFRMASGHDGVALIDERTILWGVASARVVIDSERERISVTLTGPGRDESARPTVTHRWSLSDAHE